MAFTYISPFRAMDHGHESDDPACLAAWEDPDICTFVEYYKAAQALIVGDTEDIGQVAFGLVRHLAELALKLRVHGLAHPWERGHDLMALINRLPPEDPVTSPDPENREEVQLAGFMNDRHRIDPAGDAGRYGQHLRGGECLASWCCIEKTDLAHYAGLIYDYGLAALPLGAAN